MGDRQQEHAAKDLSKYGGAYNGALIDSAVQEYDLKTGKLLRNWDALDHIPLSQSQASLPTNGFPWDAYHVNSIQLTGDGKFLVSMRDTWAAYLVDIASGTDRVDARRQELELQVRRGRRASSGSTTWRCRPTRRSRVRRPLLPADRRRHLRRPDRAVARARAQARPAGAHGDARRRSTAARGFAPNTWATRSRCRTATCSSAGARNRTSPSTTARASCCSKASCPGPTSPTARRSSSGSASRSPRPRARRAAGGRQDDRLRELERRHRARVLAGAGRPERRALEPSWPRHAKSGFETAIPLPQGYKSFKVQALGADGRVIGSFPAVHARLGVAPPCRLRARRHLRHQPAIPSLRPAPVRALRPAGLASCSRRRRPRRMRRRLACELGGAERPRGDRRRRSVAVSPQPGTPDASPSTQISFLGGAGTKVSSVRVVGSQSGAHAGVLRAYSTGTGESFLPSHPFRAGEKVTVHATGQRGGREHELHDRPPGDGQPEAVRAEPGRRARGPALQLGARADALERAHHDSGQALGDARLPVPGALPGQGQGRSDDRRPAGQPGVVPAARRRTSPRPTSRSSSTRASRCSPGGRVASSASATARARTSSTTAPTGAIATIRAGNGYRADLHEIRLTPEGTAWIDVFDPIHMNLSSVHGAANGIVLDSVVQQIDVKTGLVMWEWHSLGHVPLSESNVAPRASGYPWDYVHMNSVDPGLGRRAAVLAQHLGALRRGHRAAAPSAGAWAASAARSSSARARASTGSTTPSSSPAG